MKKNFVKLIGAEYHLLQKAGSNILTRFYFAAIAIVIALFLTFGSISYAIDMLFHNHVVEIMLSCFFVFLFGCIYIFLINTFAKEDRPDENRFVSASNLIRVAFVVFIALVVALPLTIYVSKDELIPKTEQYKTGVLQEHTKHIAMVFRSDLQTLNARELYCRHQKEMYHTSYFDREIAEIESEISGLNTKAERLIAEAERKINGNSFFLYQIKQVCYYPKAWLLTLFITVLFILPGYLVYSISSDNAYYQLKKIYEKDITVESYEAFTKTYYRIFSEKYGLTVEIFSRYEDPPFKRIRKSNPGTAAAEEFLKKFIS